MVGNTRGEGGLFGAGRRASARFYLSHIMFPVLDNVAASHSLTINDQVAKMIRNKDSLQSHLDDPKVVKKIEEASANPGVRFLLRHFKSYLSLSRDEVFDALPWWIDRIEETRPSFHKVLVEEPGGGEWFGNVLFETLTIFREYLKE